MNCGPAELRKIELLKITRYGVATQQCVTSLQLSLSFFLFLMQIESHCLRQKEVGGETGTKMLSRKRKSRGKERALIDRDLCLPEKQIQTKRASRNILKSCLIKINFIFFPKI